MTESEKDFAVKYDDPFTLKESNASPCSNFQELYSDCEINSLYADKLESKMKSDLQLLEIELLEMIQKAEKSVNTLRLYITEASAEQDVDPQTKERAQEHIHSLDDTRVLFSDATQYFTKTKAVQMHLHPILNMGGYRSLIICMIDTLALVIHTLDKSGNDNITETITR